MAFATATLFLPYADSAIICAAERAGPGEEECLPVHLQILPDHVHGICHRHPVPAHSAAC